MISSYFFFTKYNKVDIEKRKDVLGNYVKRNLKLYLFWMIVLLPIIIVSRGWFTNSVIEGLILFARGFLFSSTFFASWYIMASIIGISIIVFLSKYVNNKVLFIISLILYLFCCLTSNYRNLLMQFESISDFVNLYTKILTNPYNSFPVSLIWITFGKFIAEKDYKISNHKLTIFFIISFLLLYIERFITNRFDLSSADTDCYIMLCPVCFLFMLILGKSKLVIKDFIYLRNFSTIIYCSHLSIYLIIKNIFSIGKEYGIAFFIVTFLSIMLSILLTHIAKRYKIIKYAF